ncbi:helix-turn-helix domain-containing protein [Pedobacter sp. HMF7647]|uniref:Helix-turn-helix domain-containing protein n=1 Tax=Hufsiella arboris TaxID=2695275 RepID=A0A7K1YCR3_9SPHI|nr:helix-turn-helix domain-containing protein [Hufsiella arboris]MXV52376.1 helix-turn-helix domain-containing protein [Hufsiella arboris]
MKYQIIQPPVELASIIRYFWVLEGSVDKGQRYVHRTLADCCPEMVFHYKGLFDDLIENGKSGKTFAACLAGQSDRYNRFSIDQDFGIFGVYLYPFAVPLIFNIPADELNNEMVDIQTIIGAEGSELVEKLMFSKNNSGRIDILVEFFKKRLQNNKQQPAEIFSAISEIIHSRSRQTVKELADDYCLSQRQFERKFKQFSGFSPKTFSRISRFQQALGTYSKPFSSLTEIAYDCGYYDQSHFIHDFKKFSGHNPNHYFNRIVEANKWKQ